MAFGLVMETDGKRQIGEAALRLAAKGDFETAKANFLSDCMKLGIPFPGIELVVMACPHEYGEFKGRVEMVLM